MPLAAGDVAPAVSLGAVATVEHAFTQPCPALDGGECKVYARRPRACGGYRCLLLQALEADEVSLPDALAVAAQARRLLAAVAAALPPPAPGEPLGPLQRARRVAPGSPLDSPRAAAEDLLKFHFVGHGR